MYLSKKMMYKCEKTVFASEDQAFQSVCLLVKMTKTSQCSMLVIFTTDPSFRRGLFPTVPSHVFYSNKNGWNNIKL